MLICLRKRLGIFVIPFISEDNVSVDTLTMQPQEYPRVLHAKLAVLRHVILYCSCLQLTPFELWYARGQEPIIGNPGVIRLLVNI